MLKEEVKGLQVGTILHFRGPSSTRCFHWKVVDSLRQWNNQSFSVQLHHAIWDRAVLNQANMQFYHIASACPFARVRKEAVHA